MPAIRLSSVDFPVPLGPHSAVVRPVRAANSTAPGTRRTPRPSSKCLTAPATSIAANVLHPLLMQGVGHLAEVASRGNGTEEVVEGFEPGNGP